MLFKTIDAFCENRGVGLLVLGSDGLASSNSETVIGSISLCVAKLSTRIPVLVVKSNSAGALFHPTADELAASAGASARVASRLVLRSAGLTTCARRQAPEPQGGGVVDVSRAAWVGDRQLST